MFGRKKRRERKQKRQELLREEEAERQTRRTALLDKLERAERGELSADQFDILSSRDAALLSKKQNARWRTTRDRLWAERALKSDLRKLRRLRGKFRGARQTLKGVFALRDYYLEYSGIHFKQNYPKLEAALGERVSDVLELLKKEIQSTHGQLFEKRHDAASFEDLWDLIRGSRCAYDYGSFDYSLRVDQDVPRLEYPADWNDLLAQHHRTPALEHFKALPEEWTAGDVLLLAAEALREESLTKAQIVLAYCHKHPDYRVTVGDVLVAELAKFVEAKFAEAALPAEASE